MKALKILSHPYLLMISFLFILISGENFGGFYLLYLLMALTYGGIHAILALIGISLLLFGYHRFKRMKVYLVEPIINIAGALMLIFSVILFFYNDKQGYNYGTFYQTVPMITLIVFSLLVLFFLGDNLFRSFHKKSHNQKAFF